MLTPDGDINVYHTYMRTGIVDVGTYTVDIALDDDGEFVDAESGSVEGGVYTAQERISAMLERDYREKMPYKIIEQVLRTGIFTASGRPVDYSEEVEDTLSPLRAILSRLSYYAWPLLDRRHHVFRMRASLLELIPLPTDIPPHRCCC
jgi:hypothetical protein